MNIDGWILNFLAAHPAPPFLLHIGTILKRIGEGDDLAFLCILLAIYGYLKGDAKKIRSGAMAVIALASSGIAVQTLKHVFGRARPRLDLGTFHFAGPNSHWNGFDSFPSGHSTSVFALAVFFSYFYPKARVYLFSFAASVALIGRVLLRDHYLTDVIAGAVLGGLVGAFVARKCAAWVEEPVPVPSGFRVRGELPPTPPPTFPHWKNLAIITLFSGTVLLTGLTRSALWDRDETEYAQATIEMQQSRNWLIPTLEGQPFIEKPVFLYWVTHAGTKIFGHNETGYRLPSALLGILCCWLTYFIAQSLWGGGTGLKSALILSSSILFTGCFNLLMTDPLFIFFSLISLWFYILAQKNPKTEILYLMVSYAAIGMAAMTKGPIAFFPIPIYLLFEYFARWGSRSDFLLKNVTRCALLSIIPVAITAPWFLYSFSQEKQATSTFFLYDNIFRFLQGMEGHTGPTYYYIIVLLLGFFPWTAFFARGILQNWRDRAAGAPVGVDHFLILTWILFLFVFFSNSANKLPHYIAPILPVMACWTGKFWEDQMREPQVVRKTYLWSLILGAVMLIVPAAALLAKRPQYFSISLLAPFAFMLAGLGAAARHGVGKGEWRKSFYWIVCSGFLFLGSAKLWALPWIERFRVMKPIGLAIRAQVPQDARLVGYFVSEPSLFIYGGRTFPKVEDISLNALLMGRETVYAVVPEAWLQTDVPYEILRKASGFAENSGEITLYLIRNNPRGKS